ncbi:hypothetical protein [Paenibacillus xerothermodurans]|uniref:hypothetical protein n=1 Tax=Paenibacillus xerothermodurans TaxID=1977292 RepID=UPI00140201EE|nr:hypothetical protein [Paenibacillus xerothermodurans]
MDGQHHDYDTNFDTIDDIINFYTSKHSSQNTPGESDIPDTDDSPHTLGSD